MKLTLKQVREFFFNLLKKEVIKLALAKLAKGLLKGAFGNWIITFSIEYLMDEFVQPLMKMAFNYMGYQYDRIDGKVKVKRLNKAGDQDEYDDAIDDIVG